MLVEMLKKEWLESARQGQLGWVGITLLILLLAALASGWYTSREQQSLYQDVTNAERHRWLHQGEKGPHSAAHYGVYVIKPSSHLSVLDPGLSEYQGKVLRLEAHKQNDSLFRPSQDSIAMQRFGQLSPAFVVQMLMPLLIILMGHALLAAERQQGTLRQLLASGVSTAKLMMAKGGTLYLTTMLFAAPVLLFALYSQVTASQGQGGRTLLFISGYSLYLFIWCALTLLLSSWMRTPRQALVWLLAIWAVSSLLLPRLAMTSATDQFPIQSGREFAAKLESEIYTPQRLQAIQEFKQNTLQAHGVSSTDELPFDWSGAQLQFGEQYSDQVFDRLYGQRAVLLNKQTDAYQSAAVLSPFIALQSVSMAASATDLRHHQLFEDAAEQHRRVMQATLNNYQRDHAKQSQGAFQAGQSLWEQIPAFSFSYPRIGPLLGHYLTPLLSLATWALLLLIALCFAARRLQKEML
ncbi:DUF3526 domain-containing protein [Bowmanella denitrificans]|uniref:DUF3526 domain-containing protein n=1 Tax=Bowmanella denitrificans TaxID=366582 RepID=A0ABN0WZN8_9ALTE